MSNGVDIRPGQAVWVFHDGEQEKQQLQRRTGKGKGVQVVAIEMYRCAEYQIGEFVIFLILWRATGC